ncbi:hypothetical protein CCACVL1_07190 [Corchorus capsularis]|uniref:Uncharacterized protein n=1 Tax=Corchorus capsularis TaxID=210143 RepID=A0A1R3J8V8_COCAP|nr:hypothetical protein CCACVL1_07190 [Corchorus capsularis]
MDPNGLIARVPTAILDRRMVKSKGRAMTELSSSITNTGDHAAVQLYKSPPSDQIRLSKDFRPLSIKSQISFSSYFSTRQV